jgi:hypothetical protein
MGVGFMLVRPVLTDTGERAGEGLCRHRTFGREEGEMG